MGQMWRTGTRIKKHKMQARKLTAEEEELALSQLLLHSFQCLLQLQCRTLVLQFGVPPQLVGVVGRLWLTYVAQWRDLGGWGLTHRQMFVRRYVPGLSKAQRQSLRQQQQQQQQTNGDGGFPFEEDDGRLGDGAGERDEERSQTGKKRKRRDDDEDEAADGNENDIGADEAVDFDFNERALMEDAPGGFGPVEVDGVPAAVASSFSGGGGAVNSRDVILLEAGELSMSLSLALLYLGCHVLREPITMQQLCMWVSLGRIPYFSPKGLPAALLERLAKQPKLQGFFHPRNVPSALRLLGLAHRSAGLIATAWEEQCQQQARDTGVVTPEMEIMVHQASQLRELLVTPAGAASAAVSSGAFTSNSSLLLRTWLTQLHFPPALHPLVLELVSVLSLNMDQVTAAAAGRKRKTAKHTSAAAFKEAQRVATQQQTNLMACLILALQLTYASRVPATRANADGNSGNAPAVADAASASAAAAAVPSSPLDPSGMRLATGLDLALVRQAQQAATKKRSKLKAELNAADPSAIAGTAAADSSPAVAVPAVALLNSGDGVGGVGSSFVAPSPIAANWSTDVRWPQSVHEARTLRPESQGSFVRWVGSVVFSRFPASGPRDFEVYLDALNQMAAMQEDKILQQQQSPLQRLESEEAIRAAAGEASPSADIAVPSASSLLLQLSSSAELVSYIPTRRGFYHAAYASLLHRCGALIGVAMPQMHGAVQALLKIAQEKQAQQEAEAADPDAKPAPRSARKRAKAS
jgi:hypothetical protein